MIDLG